ncbi:acyltransferase [Aminobacter anthyllidis]|uniref:Acyltransferase n=2 Tax=Aminobacter anthyllidis TaxID=1035067 RepID=A0A9X1AI32_9HYPH|nr:acyltransferase [Aminobacter anthyllidis]
MQQSMRLHYIDWLRVSAFAILILYHSSIAFFPDLSWLISSPERSAELSLVMMFPRVWRLALLFFVSGMGTWFAFRSETGLAFLRGRFTRLFLPLIFAMCVIIVPQVWYERLLDGSFDGSLMEFWVLNYFTEGRYPTGNFSWAHMWFVAYLLVMTVACYPVFLALVSPRMRAMTDRFERTARSPAIYLLVLLPLALNLALSPIFPRQTNLLYNDGAWFAAYASWFGLGFLIARHHQAVIGGIIGRRWLSAAVATVLTAILYRFAWVDEVHGIGGAHGGMNEVLYKTLSFTLAWCVILTAVGFAALYVNRPSKSLAWLNAKIFPLYIAHQTFVVMALYYVLPLDMPLMAKYALVVAVTTLGSLVFAVIAERLPAPYRTLVGLADKKTAQPAPATKRLVVAQTPGLDPWQAIATLAAEKRPIARAEN